MRAFLLSILFLVVIVACGGNDSYEEELLPDDDPAADTVDQNPVIPGQDTVTPDKNRDTLWVDAQKSRTTAVSQTFSAEDYSGITWVKENQYAVVSDKKDGFYLFELAVKSTGIEVLSRSEFKGDTTATRDCEGIVYHPGRGTFFIAGESDKQILEYRTDGTKTGTALTIPDIFKKAGMGGYGFESLAYDATTDLFWTTSESTLPCDGTRGAPGKNVSNLLRLQSFDGKTLEPAGQYAYKTDPPQVTSTTWRNYAFGVPEITALPDGRLLILEREFFVTSIGLGSTVVNKLYLVSPADARDVSQVSDLRELQEGDFLEKKLLTTIKTSLNGGDIANYEGMCLGPVLGEGKQALLLVNDSQSRYSNILKEYCLLLTLEK